MENMTIEFHDSGPDMLGRRFFTLTWTETDGVWRSELAKDGQPVGYRRGQCFRCDPERFLRAGADVIGPQDSSKTGRTG